MGEPLKLMLASDLMLGRPMRGMDEWPERFRDDLLEAPLHTTQRLVDAAILHAVDFVILAGNVVDSDFAGPRTFQFIADQIDRLSSRKIGVVWAEGKLDRFSRWPESIDWPERLVLLSATDRRVVELSRGGETQATICRLTSRSQSSSNAAPRTICVGTAGWREDWLQSSEFDLAIVGGQRRFADRNVHQTHVIAPGLPQPRSAGAEVRGSFALVTWGDSTAKVDRLPSAAVEFGCEVIHINDEVDIAQIKDWVGDRLLAQVDDEDGPLRIVRIDLQCDPEVFTSADWAERCEQIAKWARDEFGSGGGRVWVHEVHASLRGDPPLAWYEEDTILGDYLKALREFERDSTRPIPLEPVDTSECEAQEAGDVYADDEERKRLLVRAREMGLSLLRG